MFNLNHAALTAFLWVIAASPAGACSCTFYDHTGFLTRDTAPDPTHASNLICTSEGSRAVFCRDEKPAPEPIYRLPANAKGSVFLREISNSFGTSDSLVLSASPTPLVSAQFVVRDLGSGKKIPAVLTRLRVEPPGQPDSIRYFAIKNRRLDACLNRYEDSGKTCRKLLGLQQQPAALLAKLHASGALTDVTALVHHAYGLFRVAPKGGFIAGHRYRISYDPQLDEDAWETEFQEIKVKIDKKPLNWHSLSTQIDLKLDGAISMHVIRVPRAVSCSDEKTALVQQLRYVLPPALEPYRDSVRFVRMVRQGHGNFMRWYRPTSLCSRETLGDSGAYFDKVDLHELCDTQNKDVNADHLTAVKIFFGFLEIEDAWHETATLPLRFSASDSPQCDSPHRPD